MIDYIENYIENSECLFDILSKTLDWKDIENKPRKEYWDNTLMTPYTYGRGVQETTYEAQKKDGFVSAIRQKLFNDYGVDYQGCFLNYYETGKDGLGWHSDDDLSIDHSKPIAIVTLMGPRDLQWKKIGSKGLESINTLSLECGSLAIMPSGMQQTHLHRIPKVLDNKIVNPRISLTFRSLLV